MAEKRMISKVISISEKVNDLPGYFDMLLFTWMIPHADDFGRLAGSPGKVKALVVPMLDKTKADIAVSLQCLNDQGLIHWYEVGGEQIIQVIQFEKHQQGLHKRTKSKFSEFPGTSGNFLTIPSELKRTELKRTEEKRTEEKGIEQEEKSTYLEDIEEQGILSSSGLPLESHNPFRMFENEGFGTISSVISDQLNDHIATYGPRWVCEAMKKAVVSGKRKLSYVDGILKNWKADGVDEPWEQVKEMRATPSNAYSNNRGGRGGKPQIEITKPSLAPPTPEEIALQQQMIADLTAKKAEREAIVFIGGSNRLN